MASFFCIGRTNYYPRTRSFMTGGLKWWYYPAPGGAAGAQAALWTAAFVLLAAFPLIFDAKEAIQWRASRSRT